MTRYLVSCSQPVRYPRTKISSRFQDSHVYVCRRTVLDVLQQKPHMDSFREEFFPWLCRVQYQRTKREKYQRGTDYCCGQETVSSIIYSAKHCHKQSIAINSLTTLHFTTEYAQAYEEFNFLTYCLASPW